MVSARKRSIQEVDGGESPTTSREPLMLHSIRNMWQFANVVQFMAIFGPVVKMESVDINDLETECLKPQSLALQEIGLAMLKFLSSHRGLTHDLFDEYTRRQFTSKAPEMDNPFGSDEVALKFSDFDVFKKIRVLHEMTKLIMRYPEKARERMNELKEVEHDQDRWRIEPIGWDDDDRTYFLLDDNRLYRLTEPAPPAPPPPKPKKGSKKARALARAEKRRRISGAQDGIAEGSEDGAQAEDETNRHEEGDNGLGGATWECLAVSLPEIQTIIAKFKKSKDDNEQHLRKVLEEHLLPVLEKEEARRLRKEKERERELLNLAKMANAKRSSRLANKLEQQKLDEQAQAEARQRQAEEAAARKEQQKIEKERNKRLLSRENRLREREARRLLHEEELAQLSEDSRGTGSGAGRMSDRRRQLEIESRKQAIKQLEEEEEEWVFDCICGLHGQVDDGEHSVSCERCNVWQHSRCLGIDQDEAERDDFHFICEPCRKQQENKQRARPRIKLKLSSASSSPAAPRVGPVSGVTPASGSSAPQVARMAQEGSSGLVIELPMKPLDPNTAPADNLKTPKFNDTAKPATSSPVLPPPPEQQSFNIPIKATSAGSSTGNAAEPSATSTSLAPSKAASNGVHNPFSSPHPDLSPPHQSPNKSRAYDTIYNQSSPTTSVGANPNGTVPKMNGHVRISTTPILPPTIPGMGKASLPSKKKAVGSPAKAVSPRMLPAPTQPAASLPAVASSSPVKQQQQQCTETAAATAATTTTTLKTPRIKPAQPETRYAPNSSPLPPSSGGVSPTKHSPSLLPVEPAGKNGVAPSSSPTPAILPPVAALSPSPRMQNLTPPVKPAAAAASHAPSSSDSANGS